MISAIGISMTLLVLCEGAVALKTPGPCCPPDQFIIRVDGLINAVDNGSLTTVTVHVRKAYDATNRLEADIVTEYQEETGEREETKIINLYPQGVRYVIRNGKCTKEALTENVLDLCVPANATFDETITIGLGHFSVNRYILVVSEQDHELQYRYSVSQEKCIPYQFSLQKFASTTKVKAPSFGRGGRTLPLTSILDVELPLTGPTPGTHIQFADFIEGIADPAFWFKPPAECKQPTDQQQADAKKMADRLRALIVNAPNFGDTRL